ncbi:MAG TPA: YdaS family helix-turn-helix protein [Pseudolabrys sp.]|nr:YdaS family helix-turn-helix protein [Pseudolabrys sp.]
MVDAMDNDRKGAFQRAIREAGGQVALGKKIGAGQSKIAFWLNDAKKGVAADYVLKIEEVTGVSRHELRPDIYPLAATISPMKRPVSSNDGRATQRGEPSKSDGHFSRHKYLRRDNFRSAEEIEDHIRALREEWSHR